MSSQEAGSLCLKFEVVMIVALFMFYLLRLSIPVVLPKHYGSSLRTRKGKNQGRTSTRFFRASPLLRSILQSDPVVARG